MRVEELRIGNLVTDRLGLIEIGSNGKIGFATVYNPIPLTEEWLVKLGFEETDNYGDIVYYALKGYGNRHYYFCFDHESITFGLSVFNNCTNLLYDDENLQHVHQLQNLYFALTGEELKIETV